MRNACAMALYAAYLRVSGAGRVHRNQSSSTASRSSAWCYLGRFEKRQFYFTILLILI